jgi:hypothetical protein
MSLLFPALPIIEFYKYLWSQNRNLLYFSLFVNYLFPILLEAAPWYFSRRLLASKLRDQRNSINHDLISGKSIQHGSLGIYTLLTLIYAAIHTLDQILKNRVVPTSQFFSLSFFTSMCRSTDA